MPRDRNILLSSAAAKIPAVLAITEAAARVDPDIRVVAGDRNPESLSGYVAPSFWAMPPTSEAHLAEILAGCKERRIGTIVPSRDGELRFWAQSAARLQAEGISVIVSPEQAILSTLDKLRFAEHARALGLPAIPATLDADGEGPFVVKERFGAGSRSIGIGLGRADAVRHAEQLSDPIFQPLVSGKEISADAWLDRDGRAKGMVLRTRDVIVDGESKVTTTFRDAALEEGIARMVEALGLRGPVVLQGLLDERGELHIIEVNARFGGASTASIAVGLDMWYWLLLEVDGADLSRHPFRRGPDVTQIRVPADLHRHKVQP